MEQHRQRALPNGKEKPYAAHLSKMHILEGTAEIQHPSAPGHLVHAFSPALIHVSWALVLAQMTSSNDASFYSTIIRKRLELDRNDKENAPTPEVAVPLRIQLTGDEKVSHYLETAQQQAFTEVVTVNCASEHQSEDRDGVKRRDNSRLATLLVIDCSDSLGEPYDPSQNDAETKCSPYHLVLRIRLGTQSAMVSLDFEPTILEKWMARMLPRRLEHVIHQLGQASPNRLVSEIDVKAPGELETIWKWNKTVPEPLRRCIHEIIEERAIDQVDAPAVSAWDGELTYGQLNGLAARLAEQLIKDSSGLHPFIPLCFEKSVWTTVAILGVMKAGCAFVMLDPSLPEQRLQSIVSHTKATRLLSSAANKSLSLRLAQNVVVIESDFFSTGHSGINHSQRPPCVVSPSPVSTAYATFTSGSTGTPKGIIITHENFASAICHQVDYLGITAKSRVFDFSSYSFDISISYALMTLAMGGCLCVPRDQDRTEDLARSVTSLKANTLVLTPTVARLLTPDQVPGIQSITFVGEPLDLRTAQQWWSENKIRIINRYGASECTAACVVNAEPSCPEDAIHIGKGLGLTTWVVDPECHEILTPLGSIGELLLEGPLLSPGYLDAPDKSAAAMIIDPTWLLQGNSASGRAGRIGRLYKTGDLVRYNENGRLIYVGRKDTQVKIRGQRVELGEIESALLGCVPDARQVIVEVIQTNVKEPSQALAAFIQRKDRCLHGATFGKKKEGEGVGQEIEILAFDNDARAKLAEQLPRYMQPTLYFSIKYIPSTASGKTDRRQLRNMGASVAQKHQLEERKLQSRRRPSTETEKRISGLWAEVLRVDPMEIGKDSHFIQLGGDSIAAMRVVAAARQIGIKMDVADIFRYPLLHELASATIHLQHTVHDQEVTPFSLWRDKTDVESVVKAFSSAYGIESTSIQDIYPCTPLQEGLVSLSSASRGDYVMQAVLTISPNVSLGCLCAAWEKVVLAMPILRTTFGYHHGFGLVQVVLDKPVQWLDTTGQSLDMYLETDRNRPMEIGQMFSRHAIIEDDSGASKWFVWTVHHSLYDEWSMHLIMDALNKAAFCQDIMNGPQPQSFIKYVLQQADEENSTTYWENALAGCACER